MASDNETVAEIREDVSEYLTSIGPSEYPSETQFEEFADRFEAAHKREVDAILKDRDDMYKSEQETVAKTNAWFGEYQTLKREVAELREFSNDMRTWFRLYYSCGSNPKSKWWRSCASCRRKRCPIHKWRKALKGAKDDSTSR